MASICFYFQMHQPLRINSSAKNVTDLFKNSPDEKLDNKRILERIVNKCYLPATSLMLELLLKYPNFKISYSISGTLIDQLENDFPQVIDLFKKLNETGRVEFLNETYYHSLTSIYSKEEFVEQAKMHKEKIASLFGTTTTFRNTELIYSNDISEIVKQMGYKTMLSGAQDRFLGWKSANFLFKTTSGLNFLLKNDKLSDDVAFKFSDHKWYDFPIDADKFSKRIDNIDGDVINLFMDYETFGEHQWKETGIFEFFKVLIDKLTSQNVGFVLPSEAESKFESKGVLNMPKTTSWADIERDTSAWNSNQMQQDSLKLIYSLEEKVKSKNDKDLLKVWRQLLISDHFYYMSTKDYNGDVADQAVHSYFSPYGTPQDAYKAYINAVDIFNKAQRLI